MQERYALLKPLSKFDVKRTHFMNLSFDLPRARRALIAMAGTMFLVPVAVVSPSIAQVETDTTAMLPAMPRVLLDTKYVAPRGRRLFVRAGDDLQAALNVARPGELLELEAGARWQGNFVLPYKPNPTRQPIVILPSRGATLPPEGERLDPKRHAAALPKIISPNAQPALRAAPRAGFYRIIGIEFGFAPSVKLSYNIVSLGEGDEKTLDELPTDIIIDRCFIHGNTLAHSKRGVQMNGKRLSVIDSYIGEIHGIGQDTQALMGWNGSGPFKIVNNFLEGPGENVIFGGSDPAIPNLVPSDIEFRRNHVFKPVGWKDGIVPRPEMMGATGIPIEIAAVKIVDPLPVGAPLYYRVAAQGTAGEDVEAMSPASDEVIVTPRAREAGVQITWSAVLYGDAKAPRSASKYFVYRSAQPPGTPNRSWVQWEWQRPPEPNSAPNVSFLNFVDNGQAGTAGSPPDVGRRWSVKNLFELKNAQRVWIEGNIFENNWGDAQTGNAILFTVRNQDGGAPWSVVQDVRFVNNIVRHSGAAFQMLGTDYNHPSQPTRRIWISNNLFDDIDGGKWDSNGMFLGLSSGVDDLQIEHNTIFHTGNITSISEGAQNQRFVFTDNIMAHNAYGMHGQAIASGNGAINAFLPGAQIRRNLIAGANAGAYPPDNFYPATIDETKFINREQGDYRLAADSPFKGKATGAAGQDIGVDWAALQAATRGVLSGVWNDAPKTAR